MLHVPYLPLFFSFLENIVSLVHNIKWINYPYSSGWMWVNCSLSRTFVADIPYFTPSNNVSVAVCNSIYFNFLMPLQTFCCAYHDQPNPCYAFALMLINLLTNTSLPMMLCSLNYTNNQLANPTSQSNHNRKLFKANTFSEQRSILYHTHMWYPLVKLW